MQQQIKFILTRATFLLALVSATTYAANTPMGVGSHFDGGEDQRELNNNYLALMPMRAGVINMIDPEEQLLRSRRQITSGPPAPPASPSAGSNLFGSLSDLGPQLEKAQSSFKVFSSIFNSGPSSSGAQPPAASPLTGSPPAGQASSFPSATQLMSQISELVRSTQDRNAKALNDAQQTTQQVVQQNTQAVQGASSGMAAALSEMVQGLQRLAMSNPTLLPEVKNLYQSVSSKLTSSSSSLLPKTQEQQVADQLTKAFQTST